jgi:hypothetical protein
MNQNSERPESHSFPRLDDKKLLALVSIIVIVFTIDSQIGYIADFIPDRIATSEGMALFIGIDAVFAIGGYLLLSHIRERSKASRIWSMKLGMTHTGMSVAHYALIAIIAVVIIQILAFAQYSILTLYAAHFISYGIWIVVLGMLSWAFFAWYRSSRNSMVLVLALSMVAYVVNGVMGLANYVAWLQLQPEIIASDSVAFFPEFDPESGQQQINLFFQIAGYVAYVLTWIGTVMLLRPYIKRLGKMKFYALMGAPMAYYFANFPLFVLGYMTPAGENDLDIMNNIIITGIASVFSGIIFGVAFLSVARTLQKRSLVRQYMMLAAYGFILFYVAGSASVSQAAYPPFGLASVAFTGLSCYIIYVGLYSAAITVSEDAILRRLIRKSVREQSKLLDSIGTAQMERELQGRVLTLTKKASDDLKEKTGVEVSITEDEAKDYLDEVLKELKKKQ